MADKNKVVPGSADGNFFVDTTCINCDNCRILAPEVFGEAGDYAGVKRQPQTADEERRAMQALICCPTGSIGTRERNNAKEVMADFPLKMVGEVYYAGFNSPKAAGGKSYIVVDSGGNWMVDAPKFVPRLVHWLEERGGLAYIFLTHRDDCADAARYAHHFGSKRIIHKEDLEAQPDAEIVLDGLEPVRIEPAFLVLPTPGHTEGHCMLLYDGRVLFSGDVLTNGRFHKEGLEAYDPHWCWYSWSEQTRSLERLLAYSFEWVLPGHGRFSHGSRDEMARQFKRAVERAKAEPDPEPETPQRLRNLEMVADYALKNNQPAYAERMRARAAALRERLAASGPAGSGGGSQGKP